MSNERLSYFSSIMPTLAQRSLLAGISQLGFANPPLRRHLRDLFGQPYGKTGALLADPTFEAVFGWKSANCKISDLEGQLLTSELVEAMDAAGEFRFGKEFEPYEHQLKSWEILNGSGPQSLIVTSGTGSGKTECFMVPILDHLTRLHREHGKLIGVRALFLYPLNALINSQRNRLKAWTSPFKDHIRFCLYNGNTPEHPEKSKSQSEVLDRTSLRDQPPPILVTNSTMLEYMLVRAQDAPILQQSQGKLEWVVLDEAHTYIGSQAAEIALLLRRVLNAFGVEPKNVRFVATSATIGDPAGEAGESLKRFLADVAGVNISRVHLVSGSRQIPPIPGEIEQHRIPIEELEKIDPENEASHRRYAALCRHPQARRIRRLFTGSGEASQVARLSEVCTVLYGKKQEYTADEQHLALRWLDLLSGTRNTGKNGRRGESFLPLRAHFFHQTLSGIWACADPGCRLRSGTALDNESWPFGKTYLDPRKHCECGSPVYEVANCGDCGTVYLLAGESNGYLHHLQPSNVLDEFELDKDEDDNEEIESEEELDNPVRRRQHAVLIVNRQLNHTGPLTIRKTTRQITEDLEDVLTLQAHEDDGNGLVCPGCEAKESSKRRLFRHGRLSASFLLGNILPSLLEYAPDGGQPLDHPYRGRRLLTFNDSRQGTARIAAKLQLEAERNRVRGLVYHLTLQQGQPGMEGIGELKKQVTELESAYRLAPNDTLRDLLESAKDKLNKAGQLKPVPFNELAEALAAQSRDMRYMRGYYRHYAPDVFDNEVGDLILARMFLVREFGRRPKRANNLETMGLVATAYPALEKIREVPQNVKIASGFDLATWRAFLKICLDFFIRAGGSLLFPKEWKSWLGMRFGQTRLVPHDHEDIGRNLRRWSSVQRGKSSSLLVRLLAYVMQVNLDSDLGKDKVDIVLRAAWKDLCHMGLLRQETDGRVLPLDQLAFRLMDCGYICPVTRRFLDTTLQGVTPYLPRIASESTARCRDYRIPLYPNAFGDESDELLRIRKAREWLAEQKQIGVIRDLGAWSTLNDRVIELAPLFKAAEHSAQQSAQRLQRYEKAFQEGDVNVLACSTTMEMGIDIGGISLVAMNNVPPHPSNYLQRAGRAGRRQEARSLAMTLCKSNPHDQSVFGDTRWAFDSRLPAPKVSLDSPVIVQRHVQAHLLSWFLRETLKDSNQEQLKLSCAAFFLAPEESKPLSIRFSNWCRRLSVRCPDRLATGLKHILRNTVHERTAPEAIFNMAADEMGDLAQGWKTEWENLDKDRAEIKTEVGEKSPAYRAIGFHIKRLEDEYLLRELTNKGFLPAHGFPGHIAPFDNYMVAKFKRDQRARGEGREDNRCRFREMPSRDLAAALREYAPGSHIVLDGVVYRSAGLTLNWHIPADQEDIREVQNLKFIWRCKHCGASGSSHTRDEARICQSCGENISAEYLREFIEPAGFAVDFYETPTNDIDTQSFIPVEQPWISLEAPWVPLPNPDLGRFRISSKGHVFHQSRGIHGTGYALCLECGRAEPMQVDGRLPDKFQKTHRKLRRSKDDAPFCPGSEDSWKIKQSITLGHEAWTDVCEIQLKTTDGIWLNDKVAATTLAVALRDALAELMGVQATELACNVKPVRMDDGTQCQSILLFDRNAAGYASSLGRFIESVFHKARHQLQCPANCDSVCPHCVMDFDQRFAAEHMDRHRALAVLGEPWLKALALPEEYAYLGVESRLERLPLIEAIWQSISENMIKELYFHVGGGPEQWDVGPSPLRQLAYQFAAHGIDVSIVIPKALLDRIEETDRQLLVGMANSPHIRIVSIENRPSAGNGWLLAEAIGQSSTTWACDTQDSQLFNSEWGQQQQVLVRAPIQVTEGVALQRVDAAELQPVPVVQGDREIELHHELDGGVQGFGKRFWDCLINEHKATRDRLQSSDRIIGLRYQDRYLFSPLSVRLLFEIIKGLREKVGEERFQVSSLIIDTLKCRSQTGRMNRPQQFLWSDWDDNDMRETVLNVVFQEMEIQPQVRLADARKAPHGRLLEIGFESGANLIIRFDQGVSYWRISQSTEHRKRLFDFSERNPERQARELLRSKSFPKVVGDRFATQLFIKMV